MRSSTETGLVIFKGAVYDAHLQPLGCAALMHNQRLKEALETGQIRQTFRDGEAPLL